MLDPLKPWTLGPLSLRNRIRMEPVGKAPLLDRLKGLSAVTLLPSTTVRRVGHDAVVLETPAGPRIVPPVVAVLLAVGSKPDPVPDSIRALVPEVRVVADAQAPRNVERAVREGYEAGAAVGDSGYQGISP